MAVVIQNFVQSLLTVSLLKQKRASEKLNLLYSKSLDVTMAQWEPTTDVHVRGMHRHNLLRA